MSRAKSSHLLKLLFFFFVGKKIWKLTNSLLDCPFFITLHLLLHWTFISFIENKDLPIFWDCFLIFLIPSRMSSSRIQCLVRNLHTYWNGYLFSLSEIILKVDKFFTWLLFFHHSLYLLLHRISISFIKHGILN